MLRKKAGYMSTEQTGRALRSAWTDLVDALNRARDYVDSPALHAPPPTDELLYPV